jgi:hypothetical protein
MLSILFNLLLVAKTLSRFVNARSESKRPRILATFLAVLPRIVKPFPSLGIRKESSYHRAFIGNDQDQRLPNKMRCLDRQIFALQKVFLNSMMTVDQRALLNQNKSS